MYDSSSWIEFTGITFCNLRVDERLLPGREITDVMLYHMFASQLFEYVRVKRAYEPTYREYNHSQMQNYIQERDRLEIRRLQAELANEKSKKA